MLVCACMYVIYNVKIVVIFDVCIPDNLMKICNSLQEKTLESAMTYAIETELSSRVQQWERRIRPILEKEV